MSNSESKQKLSGKAETLHRITQAARKEFAEKGLAKAHIQVIADNAKVTKQLIYHYYQSKEQLFANVLDELSEEVMSAQVALNLDHLSPTEALRTMLYHMFDQYRADPHLGLLAIEGIRYHENHATAHNHFVDMGPTITKRMCGIIQRGIDEGIFQDQLKPSYIFASAGLLMSGAYTNRYLMHTLGGVDTSCELKAEEWKKFVADMILSAIEKR